MNFADLGLADQLLKAVEEQGYATPSPIQAQAIPPVLAGKDVMAAAQTGTGKTAGFTLPLLHNLSQNPKPVSKNTKGNPIRALVLTPTRELAAQVAESVSTYGKYLPLKSDVVFGGVKINPQMQRLRGGVDILVATPGRLLDLHSQNAIRFDELEVLILDEADRMLDMGFIHDIRKVIALVPPQRQNLLFSATFSKEIRDLAKRIVNNPVEVSVTPANSTAKTVKQWLVPVDKAQKTEVLITLINENDWQQVLVFSRTKHGANKLVKKLEAAGINAAPIHGNKSQGARTKALAGFKSGDVRVLVATDIAARGIDIDQLPQVVNFDLPNVSEDYVHRIGRTGRAGADGQAVSLVSADEADCLFGIERLIQKVIERRYHDDFYPTHEVPESKLDTRPIKPKRPKKTKNSTGEPASPNRRNTRSNRNGRSNNDQAEPSDGKPSSNRRRNSNNTNRRGNSGNRHNSNANEDRQPNSSKRRSNHPNNRKPSANKQNAVIDDNIGNTIERDTNQNRDVIRDPYENSHSNGVKSGNRAGGGRNKNRSQSKSLGTRSSANRSNNNSKNSDRNGSAPNANRRRKNGSGHSNNKTNSSNHANRNRSGNRNNANRRSLPRDENGDIDGNR